MTKSLYLLLQETIDNSSKSSVKIMTPLGIYSSFKSSIYQCIRFNLIDKMQELKAGNFSSLFDIYIQEMFEDENTIGNTYILLDKRKTDYLKYDELKLFIENSQTGKIEEIDDSEKKDFKKVCRNTGILEILTKYNNTVESFLKDSDNIEKLKQKKQKEQDEELHRKFKADISAYIKMKQDKVPIPILEFNRLSRRELENLTFDQYKKIRKKINNEFQDLKMFSLPVPKQTIGHNSLNPENQQMPANIPRRRRRFH